MQNDNRTKRDAQIDFGPVHGHPGDRVFVAARLAYPFRGEKLVAEDSADGRTRICQIYVDGRTTLASMPRWRARLLAWSYRHELGSLARLLRRHPGAGLDTAAFAPAALGNGLSLPTCPADREIVIEVEFLTSGTWHASMFGQMFGTAER